MYIKYVGRFGRSFYNHYKLVTIGSQWTPEILIGLKNQHGVDRQAFQALLKYFE